MPQISASVDFVTISKVNKLAGEQKRSFSEMVNILLTQATAGVRISIVPNPKIKSKK